MWAHNLDHLGTPGYTVLWATGEETYRRFTPFGTPRSDTTNNATGASDVSFTGQRDDGDLDLLYYGGRFYDPVLGQFTRPDPVTPNAFAGSAGWNRFAYVFNNPVLLNDPSGFCPPNSGCYTAQHTGAVTTGYKVRRATSVRFNRNYGATRWQRAEIGAELVVRRATRGFVDRGEETVQGAVQAVKQPKRALSGFAATASSCGRWTPASQCLGQRTGEELRASYKEAYRSEGAAYAVGYAGFDAATALVGGTASKALRRAPDSTPPDTPNGVLNDAASSADNRFRLNAQLTAQEIAGGHAYTKHVVTQGEFPGIRTRAQFAEVIETVISDHSAVRNLINGRTAYWRDGVVVIRNPRAADGGTAFVPRDGYDYFLNDLR